MIDAMPPWLGGEEQGPQVDYKWNFTNRTNPGAGDHVGESLVLGWFLDRDSISDDYTPDEISATELFGRWLKLLEDSTEEMKISWWIPSLGELAPFMGEDHDFLTYYGWPVNATTGEPLNWLTLPVQDKQWNDNGGDKGGFIQEVTGWKPSPLQRTVNIPTLLTACGWKQR